MLEKFTDVLERVLFVALWVSMGALSLMIFAVVYKAVYM